MFLEKNRKPIEKQQEEHIKNQRSKAHMKKYFVDTCVLRDFYEDRLSKTGRPLGNYAAEFVLICAQKKYLLILSETLFWELKKDYPLKEVEKLLKMLQLIIKIQITKITKEEYVQAKEISKLRKLPLVDCINAIQSKNHQATLITRDKHFFKYLSDIAQVKRPEDII